VGGIPEAEGSRAGVSAPPRPGQVGNRRWHTRLFLLILLPPIALTEAAWPEGGLVREVLEWSGYVAIVVCVLGRAWCATYIAGRKSRELVDRGPYSIVRNPLYGFSLVGLTGVGLSSGSITWAALLLLGSSAYYRFVVGREESHLCAAFPVAFERYRASTPRWIPALRLWRDAAQVTIRPALVARTLLDGACFFAAVPLLEALAAAHAAGLLPSLLTLP
jgi:protein-S-isoprenylcysteine O-methyltransferase Ste14